MMVSSLRSSPHLRFCLRMLTESDYPSLCSGVDCDKGLDVCLFRNATCLFADFVALKTRDAGFDQQGGFGGAYRRCGMVRA